MDQELRSHLEMRTADLVKSGLSAEEARRRARLEFGSLDSTAEQCREALPASQVDIFSQDLRYSLRVLRKSPGFAVAAALTLALAIGANAAAFAALNAIILKPLQVPRAESLYSIHRASDNSGGLSYPAFRDFQEKNRSFEDLAAYNILQTGLDYKEATTRDWAIAATGNYFDVLGIQPQLGRFFHASDEKGANSAPFIVLSNAYWQSRFDGDPSVIGRRVRLNKQPFTIIGVAPASFTGTLLFFHPDYYVPVVNVEQLDSGASLTQRGNKWLFLSFGHLKDRVTPSQAAADLNEVNADLVRAFPKDHATTTFELARPSLYGEFLGGPARAFVSALMLLAALILVAACANLGSLFAARAADRSREIAMRLALGAGRGRIMRQLLTESTIIALVGGAVGLYGSIVLLQNARAWQPLPQFPVHIPIQPDERVYAVALLLALCSGLLFGIAPLRQVMRTDPYDSVKAGARATAERKLTLRDALVVFQIAICALLVTSSFVAVRGLMRSMDSEVGFDARQALLVESTLDIAGYKQEAMPKFQKRMLDATCSMPGVLGAGLIDTPPLANGSVRSLNIFDAATTDTRPANAAFAAVSYRSSPGYLDAARTRLLRGRDFSDHDQAQAPRVAMVNREFAVRMFQSVDNALGRQFRLREGQPLQVVGVVEDGKYQNLTERQRPAVFLALYQSPVSETNLVIRSERNPEELAAAIRSKIREMDPGLPVFVHTWKNAMNLVLFPSHVATFALGVLGAIGGVLSLSGIFGLAAYSISRRMKELGIRMALGAQRRQILEAALGRSFRLLGYGSLAGLALGFLASQLLSYIVYQASPRDPMVMAGAVGVMMLLGLTATWIPARRALSVDPLTLLRED